MSYIFKYTMKNYVIGNTEHFKYISNVHFIPLQVGFLYLYYNYDINNCPKNDQRYTHKKQKKNEDAK